MEDRTNREKTGKIRSVIHGLSIASNFIVSAYMETQDTTTKSMSSLLQGIEFKKITKMNERSFAVKELYELYTSLTERALRRKENWKRYRLWLMSKRIPHTPENVNNFKRVKSGKNKFIDELSVPSFAYMISHIKTQDLYYVLSVCRDKNHRNESVGAWILSFRGKEVIHTPALA